jgi:hypothetical protein
VQRNLGPIEHHEQFTLIGMEPRKQPVEGDESGLAREDALRLSWRRHATRAERMDRRQAPPTKLFIDADHVTLPNSL